MSFMDPDQTLWVRGSSSRGDTYSRGAKQTFIVVDDKVLERLLQRAATTAEFLMAPPTLGTPFSSGTAARAYVVTVSDDQRKVPTYIFTIKRITGFSWEKVGDLLGVSRQTVYNWTQGEAIKLENARQVATLHDTLAYIDRGSQAENHRLLETVMGGRSVYDIIKDGDHAVAKRLAGKGSGRPGATWTKAQPRKPSGRQDHWTDRVAAQHDELVDPGLDFVPNKVVKKIRLKRK